MPPVIRSILILHRICSDEPRYSVTAYASLKKEVTYEEVKAIYDAYYGKEQFVRVLDKDVCPETKWVEGSNYVDVNFKLDPRTNRVIMMGAMDNLVKGAAGQAVQNMNLDVWICRERRPSGQYQCSHKTEKGREHR